MRDYFFVAFLAVFVASSCQEKPLPVKSSSSVGQKKLKVPVSPGAPEYLPRREFESGWIKLFDGKTLFGWLPTSKANWRVEKGVIVADGGNAGLLLTSVPFADYELRCEYRLEKGGNSGIFLRTVSDPQDPARDCYELNLCDSHPTHPTGSLVKRKKSAVAVGGEGTWKQFHVTLSGRRILVKLDGRTVLDFSDDTKNFRPSGYIGLQFRQGKIEFRSISLKPLARTALFNGTDLTGWKTIPGAKCKITVSDSALHLQGGPGFVQSNSTYDNFILQTDVRTNAKRVNSGIFFRSMTGTEKQPANGYELQVHHGFKDGDRSKPDDYKSGYGTGAIFRFAKARWIVANDEEWCTLTLVAHGNRFATWVNGHPVAVWTDNRKPNENPRRGQRLKAGRLILQAHDPTTDVSFRNLWLSKLPVE